MKIKLKPCPFCGSKAKILENSGDYREPNEYRVACSNCGVLTKMCTDKEYAVIM